MERHPRRNRLAPVLLFGLVVVLGNALPARADTSLAFYGAPWADSPASGGFHHAFVCVVTTLASGSKEDCFGFYPADGNKAMIGGPGTIAGSDIRRISDRSASTSSIPISDDQRREVFRRMDEWSSKNYQLNYSNCIDFVDSLVRMLKLTPPQRTPTQTPVDYVRELKRLNSL